MPRLVTVIVLVMIATACAGLTALAYRPGERRSPPDVGRGTAPQEWYALTPAERLTCVRQYRDLIRRPDAREVFRRARQFRELPAAERDRMRALNLRLQDVLSGMPAARRLSLLSLHERARAEAVYRILESEAPEVIEEFRRRP